MLFKNFDTDITTLPKRLVGPYVRWRNIWKTPMEVRFWKFVYKKGEDECWPFIGGRTTAGYGVFNEQPFKKGRALAHRTAYKLTKDKNLKKGMGVFHHCDNPPCCNPKHLFSGPQKLNVEDMIKKGRKNSAKGTQHSNAIVNEDQVREMRKLYATGKYTCPMLAPMFGLSKVTVWFIIARKKWKHVH